MTSRGHVTIPEAIPAAAPHKALTVEFGKAAHLIARLEDGKPQAWFCIEGSWGSLAGIGAYFSLAVLGDGGGSGSSVVIVQAGHGIAIRGGHNE